MRLLTKSRFKLGLECPNKLYYTNKRDYANQKQEDPFLMALAEGGFQVEEYARMHHPGGIMIESDYNNYDYQGYHDQTQELLNQENVIIYEAAFLFEGLFIRADILEKRGNVIYLREIKAKSWGDNSFFVGVRGDIKAEWKPYLWDLAFQSYVVQKTLPSLKVVSSFVLADKNKKATVNGMNQMFRIKKGTDARADIQTLVTDLSSLGDFVLIEKEVSSEVSKILNGHFKQLVDKSFLECVELLSKNYKSNNFSSWAVDYSACKKCEFKTTSQDEKEGKRSGFNNCLKTMEAWGNVDFIKPNIFDIWDWRYDKLVSQKKFFKKQLTEDDVNLKSDSSRISRTERQWLQIVKDREDDLKFEVLQSELKKEIRSVKYPLHFIDFETATVALPFHEGRKPYETIAFQFSHHIMYEDGKVEHANEYINTEKGVFPNFDFLRNLKKALSGDRGSVFRYSSHENTVLNHIRKQLEDSTEVDKDELIEFILLITNQKDKSGKKVLHKGERDMVDLCKWVKDYYYNPLTKGSNSLKAYLPASINSSSYLQGKYSNPIGEINLSSLNFDTDKVWLKRVGGVFKDPYLELEPIHSEYADYDLDDLISSNEEIKDGGAALVAYAKLQYTDMEQFEVDAIKNALLRYCELDTLAMVMIFEHLQEISR
ncbi:DUF2779 domain-containing protein [Arcticibacterium luteifluviistationis]|uniref:DUF2779 domain-containing protein n=1 Tax=Arcticibacterium luteifluviistationis TaxID=1784714 RepID=A0A2Z4GAU8_9BACT|nr:DUF2779 domain-containing protein [Arcticibacterium luteifluviistationis]AWV98063.1 DUF2779 domain-containing protein [Arcticibacterium luteifluviistationis]